VTIQAQILELLRDLRAELGMSVILISHDLGVIAEFAQRVLVMYAGRVVEEAPVRDIFRKPLHPYSDGLLAAVPRLDEDVRRLPAIPGNIPDPGERLAGCDHVDGGVAEADANRRGVHRGERDAGAADMCRITAHLQPGGHVDARVRQHALRAPRCPVFILLAQWRRQAEGRRGARAVRRVHLHVDVCGARVGAEEQASSASRQMPLDPR